MSTSRTANAAPVSGENVGPYLVEVAPRGGREGAGALSARARETAGDVRFLRSIYVPEDDRWFLLYEAGSAEAVAAAAERADVEVVSIGPARTMTRGGDR